MEEKSKRPKRGRKKLFIAEQAVLAMDIPEAPEPPQTIYIVTAVWTGRGPMHGMRKVFARPHLTEASAEKAALNLKSEYKKRKIYLLQ